MKHVNRYFNFIEITANATIVVVGILLCITLIRINTGSHPQGVSVNGAELSTGDHITIKGVDFKQAEKTLVLALREGCH